MNDEDKNTCYCGKLEDSNRERERAKMGLTENLPE